MTAVLPETMKEVHRWRGTPEQRAIRDQVRKLGQFSYFDRQLGHPGWNGKKVLDFGGNDGNLLRNPECTIAHEDYWCVDVIREAVDEGRAAFPRAHWVHYDRYNCSFNPDGTRDARIPDLGVAFDFILAYSVFTHTTREEMHDLVAQLRAVLAPGGALAFTFEDPHYVLTPDQFGVILSGADGERSQNAGGQQSGDPSPSPRLGMTGLEWCSVVDRTTLHVNSNGQWRDDSRTCMTYDVYYTADFMGREFPDAEVREPVNGEQQHCCVIRRD